MTIFDPLYSYSMSGTFSLLCFVIPVFSTLVASLRSTLALDLAICQSFDHRLTRGSGIEKRSPRAFDAT